MHMPTKHFLHNSKENGGRDPGLGYLKKEEEDFFGAIPQKRTTRIIKFDVRKFKRFTLNLAAILRSCFIQMSSHIGRD